MLNLSGLYVILCDGIFRFFPTVVTCCRPVSLPDPFADATKGDDRLPAGTEDYIHIRIQQRNGRKTLTTVQGISANYDKKKLVKAFKKVTLWGLSAVTRTFHLITLSSICVSRRLMTCLVAACQL